MPRAVLDSSPLRTDTANRDTFQAAQTRMPPRPLKRSASAASLASLPTPPQTIQHKGRYAHSRSRSRGSGQGSDEDADEDEASDGGHGASTSRRRLVFARKRQRTDHLDAVLASLSGEDSENPFWDGDAATGKDASSKGEDTRKTTTQPSSQTIGHTTTRGKAPVSPPPSRRQTSVRPRRQSESAPSTPKSKVRERRGWSDPEESEGDPIRDSPNNPFLDDSPMSVTAEPVEPRTPTEQAEKPTLAYVFRGVKATFANPLYNLPPEIRERAMLPVDHPDYSPDPACPPKLLFAEARRRKQPASPTRATAKSASRPIVRHRASQAPQVDDGWDDSDDELHITPPRRLLFRES